MPDNKIIKHFKGIIKTLLELYGNSMCSSKDHFRSTSTTLGARDFSSAVSGFCQVFIGQHRKFPPHARKTSGTQGILQLK